MKWIDVQQNTNEWQELRTGRITSSEFSTLLMKPTTYGFNDLIGRIADEKLNKRQQPGQWNGNYDTENGHIWEQYTKEKYENQNFQKIYSGGFWEYDDYTGGSPDGYFSNGELIEIKTHKQNIWQRRMKLFENGEFELSKDEYWQCQGQMFVSGKKIVNIIIAPRSEEYNYFIFRFERDEQAQQQLKDKLDYAKELIQKEMQTLKKYLK